MRVLVDSCVLLDVFAPDAAWYEWSAESIVRCATHGRLVINHVVFAEISVGFSSIERLDKKLPRSLYERAALPWEAAFLAGKAFIKYRRVGADEEVGKRGAPRTAGASVVHEGLAGQESSLPRKWGALVEAGRQLVVERLDAGEADRDLREHDVVDHEAAIRRTVHDALSGPLVPRGVRLEHVEQHIAVDEHAHRSVFAAREGHDLVGGHLDVG